MDTNTSCVGPGSKNAGIAPGCKGCPNASACASSKPLSDADDLLKISRRLSVIKHIILVISGKGGVGKSTISVNIARYLSQDESVNVGLLDIDICGPSIPRAMNLEGESVHTSANGWSPIYVNENLLVMSIGFLVSSLDDAVIWKGPKKQGIIKQFLTDVDWPQLDYLIIDTPPGNSDEHISIVNFLKGCSNLDGAIIVATPQEVALLDVRKQINFCLKIGLKILGVVENMTAFYCSKCNHQSNIFKPTTGGALSLCKEKNIPLLGQIPLDSMIARNLDSGTFFYEESPETPSSEAFKKTVEAIKFKLNRLKFSE